MKSDNINIVRHPGSGMPVLSFTLLPEALTRIHDAILCLAKFSEVVSLEARPDKVGRMSPLLR